MPAPSPEKLTPAPTALADAPPLQQFTLVLAEHDVMTEAMAEALYEAGCDDGTACSSEGEAYVHFDREADTLEAAIRSAVRDVTAAGFRVQRIEIEPETLVPQSAA